MTKPGKPGAPRSQSEPACRSEPASLTGEQRFPPYGGSKFDAFNEPLLLSVLQATWVSDQKERSNPMAKERFAAMIALAALQPVNEVEGMIAAQMVAAHNAVMECHRRAMLPAQSPEYRQQNLNFAAKFSRSFSLLLDTLQRYRGKGQQKVTVEHVHVHAGGQAVVGVVAAPGMPGGGSDNKTEEQPHAKRIADAQEPALWSTFTPDRQAVPEWRDDERPLPDARRHVSGRSQRQ